MVYSRASLVKESACNAGDLGSIPGSGRSLEKGTDTHTSISAWRILWTEELVDYSPWSSKESDMTERLGTHTYMVYSEKSIFLRKSGNFVHTRQRMAI